MKKIKFFLILFSAISVLMSLSLSVYAEKTVDTAAQAKLMAKRAATEDAYRNLAETIYGIEIDSKTTVKNFVTQSDDIRSRVSAVIKGAEIVRTDYLKDGTCEVEMHLKVMTLQKALRKQFAYMGDTIKAVGYGVPNPVNEEQEKKIKEETKPAEEEWTLLIIKATGSGVPPQNASGPQARLMAQRAAQSDALRNLGENVLGVEISSKTFVKDFVTQTDEIKSKFNGFIQGAEITAVRELQDGSIEVDVQIALAGLKSIIKK